MTATYKYKEDAYRKQWKKNEFGGSDLKNFDHYAFYAGYNTTNVFYSILKAAKRVWEIAPRTFHNCIPYNTGECPLANIIRKLQSIVLTIKKQ